MLRPGWNPPPVHLNVISGRGGLGDTLARLPAFRFMHEHYQHVSATVYVQDGFLSLVEYLLPPRPRLVYKKLSQAPWELKQPYVEFDMNRLTTLNLHLTDHAFLILMDLLPPSQADKAYDKAELYVGAGLNYVLKDSGLSSQPYIVFTTDFTAASRAWPAVHINTLAKMCVSHGLTAVLLGRSQPIPTGVQDDEIKPKFVGGINLELFVDLRNHTTLIEALGVMQRAKAVVGVDNGLLHLAHCTDTPVVMGFTSLIPAHRVPVREAGATETLVAQVPCAGCQSRGFAINTDWRECLFDDYLCTMTLTASRFWAKLKELKVVT